MPSFDTIVIGGGTNGLAAAGRLAKAGQKVVVLETRHRAGGGADRREFAKGYWVDSVAHLLTALDPRVEKELALASHGLRYVTTSMPTTALCANGDHLVLQGAYGETVSGVFAPTEAAAWQELRARLLRYAAILRPFKSMTPPRLQENTGSQLMQLAKHGLKLRMLGRDDMQDFLRMLLINVADVLDDELADDRLKGLIAHDTVLGAYLGPRSPNSLLLLLNRLAGEMNGVPGAICLPNGGVSTVADAMVKALESLGVEIRPFATVKSIVVKNDKAVGVIGHKGEIIAAQRVVSAVNPWTTFHALLDRCHLDTGFSRRVDSIRMRGSTAKLHLALTGPPDFRNADLKSRLVIAPSIRKVEDAFNYIKYGEFSPEPIVEIILPTAFGPGDAPQNHHVLSAIVQYVPFQVQGGWLREKPRLLRAIMSQLEAYAPGISKLVAKSELLTPEDLQNQFGFRRGCWHHGDFAVEQMLFLRPFPGAAQYETPIANLYLASAGCHPGGGISGSAGWNAATRILQVEGRQ